MGKIIVPAKDEALNEVLAFVDEILEANDCSMKAQMQIDIAVEELFVNIAHYAYGDENGEAEIEASVADGLCTISFKDKGVEFDPLKKPDPDITLSAEERQIGGLGIFMVKKSMNSVAYERKDSTNILTITKSIN